jgi:RNA polymerase sigma-70 factor (ECF subfamily)
VRIEGPLAMMSEFQNDESDVQELFSKAKKNDVTALNALLGRFREPLKRVIRLRLNPRLKGRIDDSDIVQEVLVDALAKFDNYANAPHLPIYLWLRKLTCLKIVEAHRTHLSCQMRDARREISISQQNLAEVNSASLADWLLEEAPNLSDKVVLAEDLERMRDCIEQLCHDDRELIALKHFEQMTFSEMAAVLEAPRSTVGRQYLRALERLRDLLEGISQS